MSHLDQILNGSNAAKFGAISQGRTFTLFANAEINTTTWSWGSIQLYIKQWFEADGWDIRDVRARYGQESTADITITAWVLNNYSRGETLNNFRNKLASITFYNPIYGSLPLFPTIYGVSASDDTIQYQGNTDPYIQQGVNTQNPSQPSYVPQSTQTQAQINQNSNPLTNLFDSIGQGLDSAGNAASKGFLAITAESLGITTPTLVLGGIVLGVVVLPALLPRR